MREHPSTTLRVTGLHRGFQPENFIHSTYRNPLSFFRGIVMKNKILLLIALTIGSIAFGSAQQTDHRIAILIHGGAGTILKSNLSPEMEQRYRDTITLALMAGYNVLRDHGSSLDAVEATIRVMEDCPLFNAGKGAVFTHEGTNELDASIMNGKTLSAGAVAAVKHIKNPITLARMVMERSKHVMLTGNGAETFAQQQGVELVPQSYFYTERRWQELQRAKAEDRNDSLKNSAPKDSTIEKHGTVGCVALDYDGNLAAGTSTGGLTDKRFGRIGDSPIIGAGTYADNRSCAVSATGDGEYFIRVGVARDIAAMVEYSKINLQQAADSALAKVKALGGTGGVIVLNTKGQMAISFNTEGMYRAYIDDSGKPVVLIYK